MGGGGAVLVPLTTQPWGEGSTSALNYSAMGWGGGGAVLVPLTTQPWGEGSTSALNYSAMGGRQY